MDEVTNDGEMVVLVGGETGATLPSFLTEEKASDDIDLTTLDPVKMTTVSPVLVDDVTVPTSADIESEQELLTEQAEQELQRKQAEQELQKNQAEQELQKKQAEKDLQMQQAEPEEFILTDTESFEPSEEETLHPAVSEDAQLHDEKSAFTIVPSHADSNLLAKQEVSFIRTDIEEQEILRAENVLEKEHEKVTQATVNAPAPGGEPTSDGPTQPHQQEAKPKRKGLSGLFSSLFCCLGRDEDRASEQQSDRE